MLNRKTAPAAFAAIAICLPVLTGCGSGGTQPATVRSGSVPLEQVRIGTPGSVFKEAVVTFVPDPNGSTGGKIQYLSRIKDPDGGQYLAQVKNNECYEVDIVIADQALDKEQAVKKMEHLIPPSALSGVEPKVQSSPDKPIESYNFDNKFLGQIQYKDNTRKNVLMISAVRTGPAL